MSWKLATGVFWRLEGEEILLARETCILRLNAGSAQIFKFLIGLSQVRNHIDQREADELALLLLSERMLEKAERQHDAMSQHINHIQAGAAFNFHEEV